ncbi:ABC transporter G family member 23-like [Photinus pyralis]|uniref:ABC transporter G family member 23-like n=1 Tax=Photinus pyralis TaxID=7054 RepID=UPI0012674EF4|nr:ABC transporter G family member 23-like [Photinus pyralis]
MAAAKAKPPAIYVQQACKSYGSKRKPLVVLDKLDMVVPQGVIYGLLGSSGCGKTTLISCLVGLLKLDSGTVTILEGPPTVQQGVAYMPQEIALYREFSIRETMKYFGWIAGMRTDEISQRLDFLADLLVIPDLDEKLKNLSGGQQRRVSFAVALLHDAELLVLDEPTVGLDPILREIIWNHLVYITKSQRVTVVITTHYIEEMRQANIIGLMREGYIVAEESPGTLLEGLEARTLEDAFLKLSRLQTDASCWRTHGLCDVSTPRFRFGSPRKKPDFHSRRRIHHVYQSHNHLKAILWKNLLWMIRNVPLMASIVLLPALIIALFCVSYGHRPYDFDISVVNHETNLTECGNLHCDSAILSCHYLTYLQTRSVRLVYLDSEEEAGELLRHGKTYASVIISRNYSAALKSRMENLARPKIWDVNYSTIRIVNDAAVSVIRDFIKKSTYDSLNELLGDYSLSCHETGKAFSVPILWRKPIYGTTIDDYTNFSGPGIMLTLIFTFSAAMSACSLLIERNEGILERSLIMGVNGVELLVSHLVCDGMVVVCQILLLLVCGFAVFGLTLTGSVVLVFTLSLLTGICGMSFGFALSSILEDETAAVHIVTGLSTPLVLLSGIVWPIEAMHSVLRVFASFFPLTVAAQSMMSILQRGWGLAEPQVYYGFAYMTVLSLLFLAISIICLKFKNSI